MAREPSSRDDIRFIRNFRRLRTEQGLRQSDVAEKLQEWGWGYFTQTTLSRLEKGDRPLRLGEARALARVVHRSVSELVSPSRDVAVLDSLGSQAREAERSIDNLAEAYERVLIQRRKLKKMIAIAEALDPEAWGDPELATRYRRDLEAARDGARDLDEVASEIPESTIEALGVAEFDNFEPLFPIPADEVDDGVDL